jgi:hypothetical protein
VEAPVNSTWKLRENLMDFSTLFSHRPGLMDGERRRREGGRDKERWLAHLGSAKLSVENDGR